MIDELCMMVGVICIAGICLLRIKAMLVKSWRRE
jgi:hypothetical protein